MPAPGAGEGTERARTRIVRLLTLVYLLLIVEGALRKWAFPAWGQYLFFVRDPFVLAAYLYALASGWWPRRQPLLAVGLALGVLAVPLAALQSGAGGLLYAAYGWRNYFYYLPLAYLIGATFRAADLARVIRLTLWLSLPIAVLVSAQFHASPDSPLNVGRALDLAFQYRGLGLDGERTRPMGPFTSDVGQKLYTVSAVALLVASWILPAARRAVGRPLLLAATAAVLTCLALSGSRGAMLHAGLVVCAAFAGSAVLPDGAAVRRALLAPTLLTVLAVVLYPIVYPEGYDAFATRWSSAFEAERHVFAGGIVGRALYGFIDFARLLSSAPLAGYGLGLGGNASTTLGASVGGRLPIEVAETDWARHIVDLGPVFGIVYIVFRIVLVVALLRTALRGARAGAGPLPLVLFAVAGIDLLYGQITGHGSVNGYTWIFTGLCIAASRATVAARAPAGAAALSLPSAPRFANLLR